MGNNSFVSSSTPVKVDTTSMGNRKIISIAVGFNESYALTDDGHIWAWGNASYLCKEEQEDSRNRPQRATSPFQFGGYESIKDITEIQISNDSSLAIARTKNGDVWQWTNEDFQGKIFEDSIETSLYPNRVLAIKGDGSLWTWGEYLQDKPIQQIEFNKFM